ncbi:MAG: hypothetical protein JW748_01390 [Anaerolineales bacterium]|nr:hypothetical protein [Anaerolineales bacterium]
MTTNPACKDLVTPACKALVTPACKKIVTPARFWPGSSINSWMPAWSTPA